MVERTSSQVRSDFTRGVIQLFALAGVAGIAFFLNSAMRVSPSLDTASHAESVLPPLVEVETGTVADFAPIVKTNARVETLANTPISPQVGGRIDYVSDAFKSGYVIKKGELLFTLDTTDFELQYRLASGELGSARAALASEQAEAALASEEWESLFPGQEIGALTAREPQLEAARARLDSAQAAVDQARLAIDRAKVFAPKDGRLISVNATLGQVVNANQVVGEYYAFDAIELSIGLSEDKVELLAPIVGRKIHIPDYPNLDAEIDRIEGMVDPQTRLLTLRAKLDAFPDLLPGQFLQIEIQAAHLGPLLKFDEANIRTNDTIWIARSDRAHMIQLDIIARQDGSAFIKPISLEDGIIIDPPFGLEPGDPIRLLKLGGLVSSKIQHVDRVQK
ncbi:MAG: efflux RND transporter periplasmic adaptor subunit [Pseudomonadota bacterium]